MKTLEKLYQDTPRQTSPDALDQQILLHAQQHAERRVRQQRRFPVWMPVSISAAVACLALVLVLKPDFDQQSRPYAPTAADSVTSTANRSAVSEPPQQPRSVEIAEQSEMQAESTFASTDSTVSGGAAGAVRSIPDTQADSSLAEAKIELERQIADLADTRELELAPAADTSDDAEGTTPDSRKRALPQSSTARPTSATTKETRDNDKRAKAKAPATQSANRSLSSLASTLSTSRTTDDDATARAWIAAQRPTAYTIQLAVARDLENLKRDVARTALDPSLVYYVKVELREDEGHAALYGSWATINAAFNAARKISPFEPWVRQFSELQ